jgi:hypothetical protein
MDELTGTADGGAARLLLTGHYGAAMLVLAQKIAACVEVPLLR